MHWLFREWQIKLCILQVVWWQPKSIQCSAIRSWYRLYRDVALIILASWSHSTRRWTEIVQRITPLTTGLWFPGKSHHRIFDPLWRLQLSCIQIYITWSDYSSNILCEWEKLLFAEQCWPLSTKITMQTGSKNSMPTVRSISLSRKRKAQIWHQQRTVQRKRLTTLIFMLLQKNYPMYMGLIKKLDIIIRWVSRAVNQFLSECILRLSGSKGNNQKMLTKTISDKKRLSQSSIRWAKQEKSNCSGIKMYIEDKMRNITGNKC